MLEHEIKAGMTVEWDGTPKDTGTVVMCDGELIVTRRDEPSVYVKWDSDGLTLFAAIDRLTPIQSNVFEQEITEQQAVELLLNLGYTITKQYRSNKNATN